MTHNSIYNSTFRRCLLSSVSLYILASAFVFFMLLCVYLNVRTGTNNDDHWHYEMGLRVLDNNLMRQDHPRFIGAHYMVARHLYNALIGLPGLIAAQLINYFLATSVLIFSILMIRQLLLKSQLKDEISEDPRHHSLQKRSALIAIFLAFFLLEPFFLRDLQDSGFQLLLVGMIIIGGWCVMKQRNIPAGIAFACAISYKTSAILVLPYLIYKRQWLAAATTVFMLVLLNLLTPALFLNWDTLKTGYKLQWEDQKQRMEHPEPSGLPFELPKPQNQSLQNAIARYVQTFPEQHTALPRLGTDNIEAPQHPLYFQFMNLSDETTKKVVYLVFLILGALLAWRFRRSYTITNIEKKPPDQITGSPAMEGLVQFSVVLIMVAILSPITWTQHLVTLWPATVLILYDAFNRKQSPLRIIGMLMVIVLILFLQRDILQRNTAILLLSYKTKTIAALIILLMVLTIPQRVVLPKHWQ